MLKRTLRILIETIVLLSLLVLILSSFVDINIKVIIISYILVVSISGIRDIKQYFKIRHKVNKIRKVMIYINILIIVTILITPFVAEYYKKLIAEKNIRTVPLFVFWILFVSNRFLDDHIKKFNKQTNKENL